jgi:hypothetical protein
VLGKFFDRKWIFLVTEYVPNFYVINNTRQDHLLI